MCDSVEERCSTCSTVSKRSNRTDQLATAAVRRSNGYPFFLLINHHHPRHIRNQSSFSPPELFNMLRGRSTQVSKTAIARRASQERRRRHSRAPTPPPPPLFTQHDQDHTQKPSMDFQGSIDPDDFHLLDNIKPPATDDSVDSSFGPDAGLILDDAGQQALLAAQRREHERWHAQLRIDRLRACERIWDDEKRRLHHERLLFLKAREQVITREKQRQREESDRLAELERMRYRHRLRTASSNRPRGLVSYNSLPLLRIQTPHALNPSPSAACIDEPFQYAFMDPSTPCASSPQKAPPATRLTPPQSTSSTVPFKDVLASMRGPLFPPDPTCTPPSTLRSELLDTLLQLLPQDRPHSARDRVKAPGLERTPSYRSNRGHSIRCAACTASISGTDTATASTSPSNSSPTSVSAPSRSGSWLSFTSRTSASTAPTSPSTSPISSWLKRSSSYLTSSPESFTSTATTPKQPEYIPPLRHSCHSQLTPVDVSACPLDVVTSDKTSRSDLSTAIDPQHDQDCDQVRAQNRVLGSDTQQQQQLLPQFGWTTNVDVVCRKKTLVIAVAQSMTYFLEIAKGLHVTTTTFSVTIDDAQSLSTSIASASTPSDESTGKATPYPSTITAAEHRPTTPKMPLQPPGYRVSRSAAAIFTLLSSTEDSPTQTPTDLTLPTLPPLLIPLLPTTRDNQRYALVISSSDLSPYHPRLRTPLPNPPPAPVFPPPPMLPRSPLRPRDPPPAGSVLLRVRPVANPALLRLRALQNVLGERGVGWEGKAREGGLGAGGERLCRVAFEGLGRSALGSEVRICVV